MKPEDMMNYRRGMNPSLDRMRDDRARNITTHGLGPQTDLPLQYKLNSYTGRRMLMSSIRPGMRLRTRLCTWTVIQNSAKLRKIELRSWKMTIVHDYAMIGFNPEFTVLPPSWIYRLKKLFSK